MDRRVPRGIGDDSPVYQAALALPPQVTPPFLGEGDRGPCLVPKGVDRGVFADGAAICPPPITC